MDFDQLDVNEVIAEMRAIIGEQGQQIAMLRVALANARRSQPEQRDASGYPPVPDIDD